MAVVVGGLRHFSLVLFGGRGLEFVLVARDFADFGTHVVGMRARG